MDVERTCTQSGEEEEEEEEAKDEEARGRKRRGGRFVVGRNFDAPH